MIDQPVRPEHPVRHVNFTEAEKKEIILYLQGEHTRALSARAKSEEKWSKWLKQFNARSDLPLAGTDAMIDMTVSRELIEQARAMILNPIFQEDRLAITWPRDASMQAKQDALQLDKAIDFICDQAPMLKSFNQWFINSCIFPAGFIKVSYDTEFSTRVVQGQEQEIVVWEGATLQCVPTGDVIFPPNAKSVKSAPWITHRLRLYPSDIEERVERGIFYQDSYKVPPDERAASHYSQYDRTVQESVGLEPETDGRVEICETYLSYRLAEMKNKRVEIIVWWHRDSGTICRAVYNFYDECRRPLVDFCYEEVEGSIYGVCAAYILEPLHRAYTASTNQRLQGGSLANSILLLVASGSQIAKQLAEKRLKAGLNIFEVDGTDFTREVAQFKLMETGFSQLPQLEERFLAHMQQAMHITDYMRGIESIQRPTATGQMALIEEGKAALFLMMERFRLKAAEVIKMMLARTRQFRPQGMAIPQRQPDGTVSETLITWPTGSIERDFFVELKCNAGTMNKQLRKQELISLSDKIPEWFKVLAEMAPGALQLSPIQPLVMQMMVSYSSFLSLLVAELDFKSEDLVPNVQQALQMGQQIAAFQQQQAASLAAAQGGAGMGGNAGGPGGAPAPSGEPPAGMEGSAPMGLGAP